jgi:hypothetical protein
MHLFSCQVIIHSFWKFCLFLKLRVGVYSLEFNIWTPILLWSIVQGSNNWSQICTMHANCCIGLEQKMERLQFALHTWNEFKAHWMKSLWTKFPIGNAYVDSNMTHRKWQKWHVIFLYRVQIQTLKHKLDYYLTCRIWEHIAIVFFFF